jgi:hypothetical protein
MTDQTLNVATTASSAFSEHDWSDLIDVGGAPPFFSTVVSALTTVETDAATFPSAAEPWSTLGDDGRRTLLFELGELHLVCVALARLPDSARAEAERRQLADVPATDHRGLARDLRAILSDVRREHADAQAQALAAPRLRGPEAEVYRRLRVLRALVCESE